MSALMSPAWWAAAGTRAIKTAAQVAAAAIGTTAIALGAVPWLLVSSTAATAAVLSLLTSLAGLPEVEPDAW